MAAGLKGAGVLKIGRLCQICQDNQENLSILNRAPRGIEKKWMSRQLLFTSSPDYLPMFSYVALSMYLA